MEMEAVPPPIRKPLSYTRWVELKGELGDFQASIAKLEEAALIYQKARDHKSSSNVSLFASACTPKWNNQKALEAHKVRLYILTLAKKIGSEFHDLLHTGFGLFVSR